MMVRPADTMRGLLRAAGDLLYPRVCMGCGGPVGGVQRAICWDCLADCKFISDPYCSCCGDPVEGAVTHAYTCGWCRRIRPRFDRARSAVRFRGTAREALHALKYGGATAVAVDMGAWLESCVKCHYSGQHFDALCCVPLHAARLRGRGYNQSDLLAHELAHRLGVPHFPHALVRLRPTPTQTTLTARERLRNVRGAFAVRDARWVAGRRFLLVDDIMTTGATVGEVARCLHGADAASVHVVSVARG